ncbi:hypothetical protein [Hyphomicrobium sp.]|uniref:hypothetical protein n=1 Tax=Hyphomicrobium sp. TaxID=82 RepID=UPI003F6FF1B0
MSDRCASMTEAPGAGTQSGLLGVVFAAVFASFVAGTIGLVLVFGRGLSEDPARAFIPAGLVYAALPGIPALLVIRRLLRTSSAGSFRDLAGYLAFSALAALLWMLPFLGLFVPTDGTSTWAAVGEMAVYHGLSGGVGGLVFWLLTRPLPARTGRFTS